MYFFSVCTVLELYYILLCNSVLFCNYRFVTYRFVTYHCVTIYSDRTHSICKVSFCYVPLGISTYKKAIQGIQYYLERGMGLKDIDKESMHAVDLLS
jgi:hypothetical protein